MASSNINISAQTRNTSGKAEVRRLRKEGLVPGVIYGGGGEATQIQLNEHQFVQMLTHHSGEFLMIDLTVDDQAASRVLLKQVQYHPLKAQILHIDFHKVVAGAKVKVTLPIDYQGIPLGVAQGGGVADVHIREVEVECLPEDIVDSVALDISAMVIGDSKRISDLGLDADKYAIQSDEDVNLITVHAPKIVEEPTDEDEEGEEGEVSEEETPAEEG